MGLFRKKTANSAGISDSTARIIRDNLEVIGIAVPLSDREVEKVFDWAIKQKESCTANACTTRFDGFTLEELEILVKELNPYDDRPTDLTYLNRRITGSK